MEKHISIKTFFVSIFILFLIGFGCFQNAFGESLSAVYNFATDRNSTTSWETVASAAIAPPGAATSALVVATFSTEAIGNLGTNRDADFRITESAPVYDSGSITRSLTGVQGDKGIGSLVYIFGTVNAAATTFTLEHRSSSTETIKTSANLVAIPLQANPSNTNLAYATAKFGFGTTSSATFSAVGGTTVTVTSPANKFGDFYVAASIQTYKTTGGTDSGEWKLQYNDGSGWSDLGYVAQRSISSNSDNGITSLVAALPQQDVTGVDFQFRVVHRSLGGVVITTDNTNIVAVFTGYQTGGTNYYFPTYSTNNTSQSTTSTTLVEAVGYDFLPRVNTDIFLHAQYWMKINGQNIATYDLYTEYGFGTVVFDGGDQQRYIASTTDKGSGASVGLATGLTTGTTYRASLRHAKETAGQTLTTNNPNLIVWDLNTFELSATCTVVPPQTPTRTPGPDNALFYDGTDNYVNVPNNARLNLTNQLSVECWVKPNSVSGTQTLIGKYGAASTTGVTLNLSGTNAQVTYNSSFGTTVTLTDGSASPDFTFSTCNWYHIAATFDNGGSGTGTLTLYVNGIAAATNATALAPTTNSNALTIGQSGNGNQWFKGVIDEVRIWQDFAFGTTALRDWMCKKVTSDNPNWSNLSAYYRFDENGLGATVYDYGSWGLNGTANAFAFGTERICSSAPIGDDSDHDYNGTNPGDFSVALSYPPEYQFSTVNDEMTATGTGGTWTNAGIQLYMVDEGPNNNVPPFSWGTGYTLDPLRYWGVFVANGSSPVYQIVYDWTLHQGLTKESWNSLDLARRDGNCDKPWSPLGTTLNTITRTLTKSNQTGTEYILGGNINSRDPLALTLIYFTTTASESRDVITVKWATATEINTVGFHVWRSDSKNGVYTKITDYLIPAEGGDTWGATYEYDDYDVIDGKEYFYKLQEFEDDQSQTFYGPVDRSVSIIGNKMVNSKSGGTCFISTIQSKF
ncbi:MAG: LamG domain-containing protein [Dissulfuribacterales bacterium]